MSAPKLSRRIRDAKLPPEVARAFAEGLRSLMVGEVTENDERLRLIHRMVGLSEPEGEVAPFEALWPHAELFLTAALTVALADGQYIVEEARQVSELAHRLGLSARQLSLLEAKVFEDIRARGAARMAAGRGLNHLAADIDPTEAPDLPAVLPEHDDKTEAL